MFCLRSWCVALCCSAVLLPAGSVVLLPAGGCAAEDVASGEPAVQILGATGKPVNVTAGELKKLPRTMVETTDRLGRPVKYSGVALTHLLVKAKVPQGEELRDEWMRALVLVEAADEYRVVFALPEFDPAFATRTIILADEQDGQPLGEGRGPFQVIVPGEKRHARWVRMVEKIRVLDSLDIDRAKQP